MNYDIQHPDLLAARAPFESAPSSATAAAYLAALEQYLAGLPKQLYAPGPPPVWEPGSAPPEERQTREREAWRARYDEAIAEWRRLRQYLGQPVQPGEEKQWEKW